jgi:hypothetical protein
VPEHALCCGWGRTAGTRVSSPSPRRISVLDGVAATAGKDVWAVGTIGYNATLTEHGDGTAWTRVPSPQ